MKNSIFLVLICFTFFTFSFAQLKEGRIQYDLVINMDPDDPSAEMMSSMLNGSTLDIYFQDQNSRSEIQMGQMMKITVVTNAKSGDVLTLMSGMIGKKAIQSNVKDELAKKEKEEDKMDIKFSDEEKTILGYACKKAVIIADDGTEMTMWYTDEFELSKEGLNFLEDQVPGAPLEFEMNMNGLAMNVSAKLVEKKLKVKNLFDVKVPEGYEITTVEELNKMGGQ